MCNLLLKLCDSTPPRCGLITGCKKINFTEVCLFLCFFFFFCPHLNQNPFATTNYSPRIDHISASTN